MIVAGGATLYAVALRHKRCGLIHMTRVLYPHFECDAFFPETENHTLQPLEGKTFEPFQVDGVWYQHATYALKGNAFSLFCYRLTTLHTAKPDHSEHPERQYLRLVGEILAHGIRRSDRTHVGESADFFSLRLWLESSRNSPLLSLIVSNDCALTFFPPTILLTFFFPSVVVARYLVQVWRSNALRHARRFLSSLHHQKRLVSWRRRRAALVHQRQHGCQGAYQQRLFYPLPPPPIAFISPHPLVIAYARSPTVLQLSY